MKTIELITHPDETTHERVIRYDNLEASYSFSDFVNPTDISSDPRNDKAFVILNAGYVQAIVFAEYDNYSAQDALDAAVDAGKLDSLQLDEVELKDYETGKYTDVGNEHSPLRMVEVEGVEVQIRGGWPEYEGVITLGNASEPFASESLDVWELPMSAFIADPALMTLARVMARLDDAYYDADRAYQATSVEDDADWSRAHRDRADLKDAVTLCRFRH